MILIDSVVLFFRYRTKLKFTLTALSLSFLLAMAYLSWHTFIFKPLMAKSQSTQRKIKQVETKISQLKKPAVGHSAAVFMKENFLSSIGVNRLIQQALEDIDDLALVSFEQLNTRFEKKRFFESLFINNPIKGIAIYPFKVTLVGSYQSLLTFLTKLQEQDPPGIFWQSIDYSVNKYPQGQIALKFFSVGQF